MVKFLKRLYACLKHYPLPEVVAHGDRCRMTGAWTAPRDDVLFEVIAPGRKSEPRFVSWRYILEVHKCH